MTIKRFMVIKNNQNIAFTKVITENGETEVQVIREYDKKTQTELDFAKEAQNRLDNEHPDWADVITWQMIAEDDLQEWLADPTTII